MKTRSTHPVPLVPARTAPWFALSVMMMLLVPSCARDAGRPDLRGLFSAGGKSDVASRFPTLPDWLVSKDHAELRCDAPSLSANFVGADSGHHYRLVLPAGQGIYRLTFSGTHEAQSGILLGVYDESSGALVTIAGEPDGNSLQLSVVPPSSSALRVAVFTAFDATGAYTLSLDCPPGAGLWFADGGVVSVDGSVGSSADAGVGSSADAGTSVDASPVCDPSIIGRGCSGDDLNCGAGVCLMTSPIAGVCTCWCTPDDPATPLVNEDSCPDLSKHLCAAFAVSSGEVADLCLQL